MKLVPNSPTADEIVRLLSLPKHTCEFTLHMKIGSIPTVTATFNPEDAIEAGDWNPVVKTYELVERT